MMACGLPATSTVVVRDTAPITAITAVGAAPTSVAAAITATAGNAMPTGASPPTAPPAPASTASASHVTRRGAPTRRLANHAPHATAVTTSNTTGTRGVPSERCSLAVAHSNAASPATCATRTAPRIPLERTPRSRCTGPIPVMLPPAPGSRAGQAVTTRRSRPPRSMTAPVRRVFR